ncbi:MAG: hypothetical protein WCJ95_18600 [Mariniphaga sp.]
MEIKLTTDWIFLHNSEVYCDEDDCYFITHGVDFQHYLVELALKTLNVNYTREELLGDGDEKWENISFRYKFENVEDIKETCPELYEEFQKSILKDRTWEEEIKRKQSIILSFLDTPKTLQQIRAYIKTEIYKKEEKDYETRMKFLNKHTDYLVDDLLENDLVRKNNNKFEKI